MKYGEKIRLWEMIEELSKDKTKEFCFESYKTLEKCGRIYMIDSYEHGDVVSTDLIMEDGEAGLNPFDINDWMMETNYYEIISNRPRYLLEEGCMFKFKIHPEQNDIYRCFVFEGKAIVVWLRSDGNDEESCTEYKLEVVQKNLDEEDWFIIE